MPHRRRRQVLHGGLRGLHQGQRRTQLPVRHRTLPGRGDDWLWVPSRATPWGACTCQAMSSHGRTSSSSTRAPWLPPLQVLIDCSNGASDCGNKFGEPLICGWTRSLGHRLPSGERFEWVMLSGGIGQMDHTHIEKQEPEKGQLVVKIGCPAYRIGVDGGADSSTLNVALGVVDRRVPGEQRPATQARA